MQNNAGEALAIAVDIGTQGTKVGLVSFAGQIKASEFIPSHLVRKAAGQVEQDPEAMFDSVIEGIRSVMRHSGARASQIAGIGIAGQMAGIIGIDRAWQAVTPYDSWLDRRCESAMPVIRDWGEEAFIQITGCPVTYAHGPKKIWWRTERPEVYRRIAKFVVPSAYVAGRLAGLSGDDAFVDYTHLHFSGMADTERGQWSDELLRAFGIDADKMPRIVRPWDMIGGLSAVYAEAAELTPGTPIVAGCGDTAASILGAGIVQTGRLLDVAGTAAALSCCVDRYRPDTTGKTLIYARSVLPDLWTPLAYMSGGGACLAWCKEQTGETYDELNRLAATKPPGSRGLIFVPHFGGRVCPNQPLIQGSWSGLGFHHDKGDLFRSILEAIAYEYGLYMQTLERLLGELRYETVRVTGGGARSELFNGIKADVLGIPYQVLRTVDSSLLAGMLLVGVGTDVIGNLSEAASSMGDVADDIRYPDASNRRRYEQLAGARSLTMQAMNDLYNQLNEQK